MASKNFMKNLLIFLAMPILIPLLLFADWFGRNYVGEQMDEDDLE